MGLRRGFSLIELLIVIAIISIILTIALPIILGTRKRAMDERARQCVRNVMSAEVAYCAQAGSYGSLDTLAATTPPYLDDRYSSGVGVMEYALEIHLDLDPDGSGFYVYTDNPGGQHDYAGDETLSISEL